MNPRNQILGVGSFLFPFLQCTYSLSSFDESCLSGLWLHTGKLARSGQVWGFCTVFFSLLFSCQVISVLVETLAGRCQFFYHRGDHVFFFLCECFPILLTQSFCLPFSSQPLTNQRNLIAPLRSPLQRVVLASQVLFWNTSSVITRSAYSSLEILPYSPWSKLAFRLHSRRVPGSVPAVNCK